MSWSVLSSIGKRSEVCKLFSIKGFVSGVNKNFSQIYTKINRSNSNKIDSWICILQRSKPRLKFGFPFVQ